MRSLRLLSASVIALLAVGATPAASRAETGPHWFGEGKLLVGEPIHVKGKITTLFSLNFIPSEPESSPYECFGRNSLNISNPPGGGPGIDEIVTFHLVNCTAGRYPGRCEFIINKVIPLGLPWRGHLAVEPSGRVVDVFEGVRLELTCNKHSFRGVFSGTLHPEFFEGRELAFSGEAAEVLSGPLGQIAVFGEEVLIGPHGHKKITVA